MKTHLTRTLVVAVLASAVFAPRHVPAVTPPSQRTPPNRRAAAVDPAELLPEEIREAACCASARASSGRRSININLDEDGEMAGLDIELTTLVAEVLGLEPEYTNVTFSSIIPGVQTGRFHIGVNQLNDTEERRREVNFVDYYSSSLAVLEGPGVSGIDPANLCGEQIAVTTGSAQEVIVEELNEECIDNDDDEIEVRTFPDSASTLLAVRSGQADIFLTTKATGMYTIETSAEELTMADGAVPGTAEPVGIVVSKDEPDLAFAL